MPLTKIIINFTYSILIYTDTLIGANSIYQYNGLNTWCREDKLLLYMTRI